MPQKTMPQKTYAEKKAAQAEKNKAIIAIAEGFTFTPEPRLSFHTPAFGQQAHWAINNADPEDRFLVLRVWPNSADPYDSHITAFGPPNSQERCKLVALGLRQWQK